MSINLSRPGLGSTNWFGAVDGNWQTIQNALNGVSAIANGGTNSGAALNGGRPIISNASAIVESSGYLRKTGAYTIAIGDCDAIIDCDTTNNGANATIAISLPAASSAGVGFRVTIVNSGTATNFGTAHAVTIAPNGFDTIDGQIVTHTLNDQNSKMTLRCTGVAGQGTGKGWIVESAEDYLRAYASGVSAPGTSNTYGDITSLGITPGEWDVSGAIDCNVGTATVTTAHNMGGGISSTSGNSATGLFTGDNLLLQGFTGGAVQFSVSIPTFRVDATASSTTYYLKMFATYTLVGTMSFSGRLSARRVR